MTVINPTRLRFLGPAVAIMMLAAACSGSATAPTAQSAPTEEDTPTGEQPSEPSVDESPAVSAEPQPAGPMPTQLELSPDPEPVTDPLETVNPLAAVNIWAVEDGVAVQFPAMENGGLRVGISDTDKGVDVFCDLYDGGDAMVSTCSGFNPSSGQFLDGEGLRILDEPADGFTYVVPLTADQDYVSITFGGVEYMAPFVTFSDSPGMVQLKPDGSLAAAVVRTVGLAQAADVAAALG